MKRILLVMGLLATIFCVAACGAQPNATIQKAATNVNHRLEVLERIEPLAEPLDSADRRIQNEVYSAEADPNKIWYLATESMTGAVKKVYTIKGPVVSANDELTNPLQIACIGKEHSGCGVIGLAEPNGTYEKGSNDHEAKLAQGGLIKFESNYETSDVPFTVKTPEVISINPSAIPTATNLSLTKHAVSDK